MNMLKKPERGSFTVSEVKSPGRDSLQVGAKAMIVDGAESYNIPHDGNYPIIPHPTLIDCLDKMKIHLADYFGYTHFESIVNQKLFGAKKEQTAMAKEVTKAFLDELKVNGISYPGKNRDGVIIKGTYKGCAINTKKMHFSNENHGESLNLICDELDDEVYEYLFNGKKAQLDMFDKEDESPED